MTLQERVEDLAEHYNDSLPTPGVHLRFLERPGNDSVKALFWQVEMPDAEESIHVIGLAIKHAKANVKECRRLLVEVAKDGTPDQLVKLAPVLTSLEERVERALLCRQAWVEGHGAEKEEP